MEKTIFHNVEENKTLGGLSKEEKAVCKETKKTKNVSPKEARDRRSRNKQVESKAQQTDSDLKSRISAAGLKEERPELFLQIIECIPAACRDFLLQLPNLSDDAFAAYAVEGFKNLQITKKTIWKVQAAIACDIFERNESERSKGGKNSKGQGIGIVFDKECADLGLSSATMSDYRRVYMTFVVSPTLDEPDGKLRRAMQMDILDGLSLDRFFYVRALSAADPFKAVEFAAKKLKEKSGEYTEREFRDDIREKKTSGQPAAPSAPKPGSEEFSCRMQKKSVAYLKKLAAKWNVSVGEVGDRLLNLHRKLNNPKEVIA